MTIEFFCPRWGSEQLPWPEFLQQVQEAGYAGIEWFPYGEPCDHDEVIALLKAKGLKWIIVTAVIDHVPSFESYTTALENQLKALTQLGKDEWPPLFISTQTGRSILRKSRLQNASTFAA